MKLVKFFPICAFVTLVLVASSCAPGQDDAEVQPGDDQADNVDPSLAAWEARHGGSGAKGTYALSAYAKLPSVWGSDPPPAVGSDQFNQEVFRRYGLFPADFDNDGLPLGLLKTASGPNGEAGIVTSCEFCHSMSLLGHVKVGVPNPFSNMGRIFEDLAKASGEAPRVWPFELSPGGNTMVNAGNPLSLMGLLLRGNSDPNGPDVRPPLDWGEGLSYKASPGTYQKDLLAKTAYLKTPAWFNYRVKQGSPEAGYYADGGEGKTANVAAYLYSLTYSDKLNGSDLEQAMLNWKNRAPAYLKTLSAPKYPFPIDADAAVRGATVYQDNCSGCHGSGGAPSADGSPTKLSYAGHVVKVSDVGTDPLRAMLPHEFVDKIRDVLLETYRPTNMPDPSAAGYVAQPLNGIWARSPYLHNGSVPTLAQLLNSPTRIARYAMTANPNNADDYDQVEVGWRVTVAPDVVDDPFLRVYDARKAPGLTNSGHTFGDPLSDNDRSNLLEYLKTL
jgi:cytochrome c5